MDCKQSGKKGKANPSDSNKRKMKSFNKPIPKKSCQDAKHCVLCKKRSTGTCTQPTIRPTVPGMTRMTLAEKGFIKGQHHHTAPDKKAAQAYAQLSVKVPKLKKANKKLKKSTRKHKREYDSGSNDSNFKHRGAYVVKNSY